MSFYFLEEILIWRIKCNWTFHWVIYTWKWKGTKWNFLFEIHSFHHKRKYRRNHFQYRLHIFLQFCKILYLVFQFYIRKIILLCLILAYPSPKNENWKTSKWRVNNKKQVIEQNGGDMGLRVFGQFFFFKRTLGFNWSIQLFNVWIYMFYDTFRNKIIKFFRENVVKNVKMKNAFSKKYHFLFLFFLSEDLR